MERESEEKSLFETAADTLGSKKKKKKGQSLEGPRQPIPDKDVTKKRESPIPKVPQDPEIKEMVGKIKQMQTDLQSRLDEMYLETGMNGEQLKTFMENPKNFLPKDWEYIQNNKHVLEAKVWETLGEELKPPTGPVIRTRANVADERKGKTLGSRKKWLPMR